MFKKLFQKKTPPDVETYKVKWRRTGDWLWSAFKVVGHKYFEETDKMVLYLLHGGLREIPMWSECHVFLGRDWAERAVPMEDKKEDA